QQEASKLRQQITNLQNSNRNLMGEALSTMSLRDLKQLENRLEKGISKIRTKKNELLYAKVEYMQKREIKLQNDNMYLRNKITENERVQQQMSMLPGNTMMTMTMSSTPAYELMPPFDARGFLQVNLMEQNQHYSHQQQQQTTLQLGVPSRYEIADKIKSLNDKLEEISFSYFESNCFDGNQVESFPAAVGGLHGQPIEVA
ncbi:MADS-box transcription factor 3-like, partial [Dioscorea cayenensis subsp. rotundata]|uniref:MADS-box transcription factor 3-like n=1 Tax=Dioscorea cayennensis subsp. rotundata TaxID=55577 RepID=A0AB40D1G1_DIOCR